MASVCGSSSTGKSCAGHANTAGEFGHVPLDLEVPTCLCGSHGCLEAYTSNLATLARYLGQDLSSPTALREMLHSSGLTINDLISRARSGDKRARAAFVETGKYLDAGLSMIVNSLNPSQIFVGGEITEIWDQIAPALQRAIAERALTTAAASTPVIPESASRFPRLRGATALVAPPVHAVPQVA